MVQKPQTHIVFGARQLVVQISVKDNLWLYNMHHTDKL